MPTIHRHKGYRFFFFSNEGSEPPHVHVEAGDSVAKVWLSDPVELAGSYSFSGHELTELVGIVAKNRSAMPRKWNDHFGQ